MDEALWIERCAAQLGRRWPAYKASEAGVAAQHLAADTPLREMSPETAADAYVRSVEEESPVLQSAFVLRCTCEGVDDDLLARAVAAAEEVLIEACVSPAGAARGQQSRSRWEDAGSADDRPTEDELIAANAWDQAEAAAFAVCATSLQYGPPCAHLELRWRSDA